MRPRRPLHELVRAAVELALERKDHDRELVSQLLCSVHRVAAVGRDRARVRAAARARGRPRDRQPARLRPARRLPHARHRRRGPAACLYRHGAARRAVDRGRARRRRRARAAGGVALWRAAAARWGMAPTSRSTSSRRRSPPFARSTSSPAGGRGRARARGAQLPPRGVKKLVSTCIADGGAREVALAAGLTAKLSEGGEALLRRSSSAAARGCSSPSAICDWTTRRRRACSPTTSSGSATRSCCRTSASGARAPRSCAPIKSDARAAARRAGLWPPALAGPWGGASMAVPRAAERPCWTQRWRTATDGRTR